MSGSDDFVRWHKRMLAEGRIKPEAVPAPVAKALWLEVMRQREAGERCKGCRGPMPDGPRLCVSCEQLRAALEATHGSR